MASPKQQFIQVVETHRLPVGDLNQARFMVAYINEQGSTVTAEGFGVYDSDAISTTCEASIVEA